MCMLEFHGTRTTECLGYWFGTCRVFHVLKDLLIHPGCYLPVEQIELRRFELILDVCILEPGSVRLRCNFIELNAFQKCIHMLN